MNLSKNTKVIKVAAAAASGTTAVTSDAIDTLGYEGVMIVGSIGTANAGNFAKVQQSSDNASSDDYSDLEGTKLVPGDDGDSYLIDVYKPQKRYLKCVVTRGAASVTGDIYAVLYGPRKYPTSHGATIDSELHLSPAEGTA